MKLYELSILKAHKLLKTKEISSLELTQALLERIEFCEEKVGAYITVMSDLALKQAKFADALISKNECGTLTGIPLAIKDLICVQGQPTTCASKMLENFISPYDASVIKRLKHAGAVLIGKTNMDEFAMGSSTENSSMKSTHNPWNLRRIPGGSSGGSAAAVAADMCVAALGSDTGGSIRQPASHCGVAGMKPTYGRVSRFGLVAFASSLDQIGPITKNVEDCAILMNFISGYDPADSTSVPMDVPDFTTQLNNDIKGLKIGIPVEYHTVKGLDPEVAQAVNQAVQMMENLGAECQEISLPNTEHVVATYYVIAPCEASSNLARYDGVKYGFRNQSNEDLREMYRNTRSKGFGPEVQRRIIIGTYCLSAGYYDAYYGKASQVRTLIVDDFKKAFEKCDVIMAPVAPTPAFKIGENIEDPLTMYLSDILTLSANLAGIPGMSVPCGFSSQGLPIGLQILGKHFNEEKILQTAGQFEQATEFHLKRPNM